MARKKIKPDERTEFSSFSEVIQKGGEEETVLARLKGEMSVFGRRRVEERGGIM